MSVLGETGASLGRIRDAAGTGASRSQDIVGQTVDGLTHGGVQVMKEGFNLPFNALVKPVARTVTGWAKAGAKMALQYAWLGLKHLPIPFVTRNPLDRDWHKVGLRRDNPVPDIVPRSDTDRIV